jgi:transcription elongation factor Elf1
MKQMTSEEYVKKHGVRCPYCGGKDISGDEIEVDSGGAFQTIVCMSCERAWIDIYELTGYEEKS